MSVPHLLYLSCFLPIPAVLHASLLFCCACACACRPFSRAILDMGISTSVGIVQTAVAGSYLWCVPLTSSLALRAAHIM